MARLVGFYQEMLNESNPDFVFIITSFVNCHCAASHAETVKNKMLVKWSKHHKDLIRSTEMKAKSTVSLYHYHGNQSAIHIPIFFVSRGQKGTSFPLSSFLYF